MSDTRHAELVQTKTGDALRFRTANGKVCCATATPNSPVICDHCRAALTTLRTAVSKTPRIVRTGADVAPTLESLITARGTESADTVAKRIRAFFISTE